MNTKLLLKVKQHILDEPRRLWMSSWIMDAAPGSELSGSWETGDYHADLKLTKRTAPPCGTVACIAGWSTLLSRKKSTKWDVEDQAGELLGLTFRQYYVLFRVSEWPEKFQKAYTPQKSRSAKARIVGQVIDDFIATDGWTEPPAA